MDSGLQMEFILSLLLKKIVVPADYHNQCKAVKLMLKDDVSGLIDSLTDFYVETASVKFGIETDNDEYTKILKDWLDSINVGYNGRIPIGINELAKEYYKERWKGSSFPVLKIAEWKSTKGGIIVPTKMFFVDGSSITAKDKDTEDRKLINYDYYIGSKLEDKYKLEKNCIFARPYGRWFDKYPTPFLIKRGIYHNYKIIESLKNQQTKILDQVIPYLLLIKKGSPELVRENIKKGYSDDELKKVIEEFQSLMDDIRSTKIGDGKIKAPIRATNFDEEIKHLIPDLKSIFHPELFVTAERNTLSGLGFIDVVEATSTSRRESILNPKGCIEEVKSGVNGFTGILNQLKIQIKQKNKSHKKYMNLETTVVHSPVRGFMTDKFKAQIIQLHDRGKISSQSTVELVGEIAFGTEVMRREKEAKRGIESTMYPQLTDNKEETGRDLPGDKPIDKVDEDKIPDDKKGPEAKNYDMSISFSCSCPKCGYKTKSDKHCNTIKCPKCGQTLRRANRPGTGRPDLSPNAKSDLETAPYKTIRELPARVKKNLSPRLQSVFMRAFNGAYKKYGNDSRAFRIAWGVIKKIAKKNKKGKWIKSTRTKVTESMIEEIEKGVIKE